MIIKICKKHGDLKKEQCAIELSDGYKCYRCLQCKREKDQRWRERNPEKYKENSGKARKEARRLYREGIIDKEPNANIWSRKDRKNNPDKYKALGKKQREKLGYLRNVIEISRRRGISTDYYHELFVLQDNKCAICNKEETRKGRGGKIARLCIDHCHKTNIVRGLLCHDCNTGLGKFKDMPELLLNAIKYLEKFNT